MTHGLFVAPQQWGLPGSGIKPISYIGSQILFQGDTIEVSKQFLLFFFSFFNLLFIEG